MSNQSEEICSVLRFGMGIGVALKGRFVLVGRRILGGDGGRLFAVNPFLVVWTTSASASAGRSASDAVRSVSKRDRGGIVWWEGGPEAIFHTASKKRD